MIKIELDENKVLGLLIGTFEDRIDYFFNEEVIDNLNMTIINKIYDNKIDKYLEDDDNFVEIITFLQALAYNRYKSEDKDEIATFVFDKLFEMISTGDCWFN